MTVLQSKSRYLMKNVALLGVSNFGSKILVVLLVPLYTYVLSAEEYGSYDLVSNTIGLLVPIFTLNIADGVMRFSMDDAANRGKIIRFGLVLVVVGSVFSSALLLWNGAPWGFFFDEYLAYIPALLFSTALYTLMSQFCRGCERVLDVAIAGIASTAIMLAGNIMFLLVFKWGLKGFFVANICAQLVPALWLLFRVRYIAINREPGGNEEMKAMVLYALPLITSTLGWWIVSVSDRYIVTFFCGLAANGLYSIAYKIPAVLNVMQGVFIQAWQISAVKEYDDQDSDGFFARTYAAIETLMFLGCSLLMPLIPAIASILFQGEFSGAWVYVPFLLVYVVFNVESGVWGGIFSAKKDAKTMAISMAIGATVNVVAGIPLVWIFGIQGAAFSTMVAGFAIWAVRALKIRDHIKTDFHLARSLVSYGFLIAQGAVMLLDFSLELCSFLEIALIGAMILLRKDNIAIACRRISSLAKK